jgi:hypothetical protein
MRRAATKRYAAATVVSTADFLPVSSPPEFIADQSAPPEFRD